MALRLSRANTAFVHDVVMTALSFALSLWLRMGEAAFHSQEMLATGTMMFAAVGAVVYRLSGLYRGIWRYASINDMIALTRAATLVVLLVLPLMFLFTRLVDLPRSAMLINWLVLIFLLGAPRLLYRLAKDRRVDALLDAGSRARVPVLLVGAGDEADLYLRALARSREPQHRVVGLLSLTQERVGRNIHGNPVLGTLDQFGDVVERLDAKGRRPQKIILTKPDLDGALVRALVDTAGAAGITVARLANPTELRHGDHGDKPEIRPIAIEDLLGRPQAVLDRDAMAALIAGRRVLVTGAGGSIGSELVRQVADFGPSSICLVDSGEFNLYAIDMELAGRCPDLPRLALVADVRDASRIETVFATYRPQLVFHAAALKHVPIVEENPLEGLRTNSLGTRIVADACRRAGVAVMVQISTDKAVNPTNVMGASKRLGEIYCQAMDLADGDAGTRFVTVRFGNVLGSTGSVVPLFQRQLAAGGPLTVTHPEVTRFFMTIREAVELVLQASALGAVNAAYHGRIFVLEMGEPVKIIDLARQVIRLAGLRPDVDVRIAITGLRPGEKLYEEVLHDGESTMPTERNGIQVANPRTLELSRLVPILDRLAAACERQDVAAALDVVHELVPEYRPPEHAARPRTLADVC